MLESKTVTVIGKHQVTIEIHPNAPHGINFYYESQGDQSRLYNISPGEMRRCESIEFAEWLCKDWNKYQFPVRYADGLWKRVYYILF